MFSSDIESLKLNRLIIDSPVQNGSDIWLHCDFQLDDAERRAFTSKFYKNNIEFYRYSITSDRIKPTKKYFIQSAVNVNVSSKLQVTFLVDFFMTEILLTLYFNHF